MAKASDAELMDRYTRGDASAFDELFGRWERPRVRVLHALRALTRAIG